MSVIIRLQNLPWTANARDIRNFFTGLSIPEGGVHIIGGEMGDAFIAFSTDEDARCAMLKDREKLMEIQVRLLLSSRAEMQKVIETARTPAPVVAPAPQPVPVPMPVPVAVPQPPIIGGLNSFLNQSQSQSKAGVPSFLAYQQQAGIVLAEVTGGSHNRRHSRSRSRSRSSSSEDSDRERERERDRDRELERERERDRAIRKRRLERGDSSERELKLQSSAVSGGAAGLSPWANPPQNTAALSLPGLGSLQGMSMGMGLGLGVPTVLPSLQNYTTSNTTNNITNNYNMNNANGPVAPAPAPPLAPDAHKLIAALQAAARAGSNSPAQMEGQQQQVQVQRQAVQAQEQPVAFASVNPYAQIYPQLFQQQQQVLLQQQTAAKLSPSMGGSPGGGGGGLSPRGGSGGMSSAVADTCYVKISGLCQSTSYSDLRKYFQGLYIPHNGIKIMTVNGSRTGVAYIEFSRVSSAQKALQRHNTMFRDRLVQIVPIGDAEFEQADEKSQRNQHQQQQPPQDVVGRNVSSDRGGGSVPSFNVLYVEDLPQLTTEQDIMKMFSATCTIVDILLAPSPNNRREFVAFVLFARETEALSALEDTSRHYIGFRQLRVRPSSQAEMMQAKEKQRRANEQLLKEEADQREELLKDQKRRQQAQAQLQLQQQQQQREEMAMQARYNSDPRRRNADDNQNRDQQQQQQHQQQNNIQPFGNTGPMPNGMMPFVLQQQLQQLQQQHNGVPQNFPFNNNNNNNMDNLNRNQNHNGGGGGGPIMDQSNNRNYNGGGPFGGMPMPLNQNDGVRPPRQEDNFVRVHNCEYATRVNDLGELFSMENLRIEHIEMLLNDRKQSSGEFIIEFADGLNAKQAIREFHNRRFRGRGLRVLAITPQEIADRMNKPFMDYLPGGNGPRQSDNGGNNGSVSGQPSSRRRGPSRFDQQQQPEQQVPQERQRQEDEDSNSSQKQHFNPFARPDPPANPSGGGGGSGSLSPPPLNVSNNSSSSIPDKFNRPGCVVAMRNVPFKAELKDILRFFSDYKLSPDDIIRRFNDDGKPTGDTRVAFESPAEARSAYESRRRKQIFSRTVHLDII